MRPIILSLNSIIFLFAWVLLPEASALEAPVVDATQFSLQQEQSHSAPEISLPTSNERVGGNETSAYDSYDSQEFMGARRVMRLEQQVKNLLRMNLPQQINELQQEIGKLNGQLQVFGHDLKLLNRQQRTFYQDLAQQIQQIKVATHSKAVGDEQKSASNSKSETVSFNSNTNNTNKKLQDSEAYQVAFKLLSKKQYDQAVVALQKYLVDYPAGQFRVNVHYWLGEIYLLQKKFQTAEQEFTMVITQFANSSKVPDAKLKLAVL